MRKRCIARPLDAPWRSVEILGEASRRTGIEFRADQPEIPRRQVNGFRNVLIHSQEGAGVESSRVGFGVVGVSDREPPAVARLDDAFRLLTDGL